MAETNGSSGGYANERLDRIQIILDRIAADHLVFQQDHQMLLRAQVVMQDDMQKLTQSHQKLTDSHEKLAQAQLATDEKLNILLTTIDDWIRRQSH